MHRLGPFTVRDTGSLNDRRIRTQVVDDANEAIVENRKPVAQYRIEGIRVRPPQPCRIHHHLHCLDFGGPRMPDRTSVSRRLVMKLAPSPCAVARARVLVDIGPARYAAYSGHDDITLANNDLSHVAERCLPASAKSERGFAGRTGVVHCARVATRVQLCGCQEAAPNVERRVCRGRAGQR